MSFLRWCGFALSVSAAASSMIGCSSHQDMQHAGPGVAPSSQPIPAVDFDALFVVNGGDSTVTVINTATNESAATIRLNDAMYPHHIYLRSDRSQLALAIPGMDLSGGHGAPDSHGMKGAVLLTDAATGSTIKARLMDAMNHNAVFSPNGLEIWTSQMTRPGAVLVLDATSLETKQTIPVGDQPAEVTFSRDGTAAFVANSGSASVSVINVASKSPIMTIPVGENPVGAWPGSNDVAYVDNETAMTLSAIDTKTLEVKTTYRLGFMPGMAALAPDGTLWITNADDGTLVVNMADRDMKLHEEPTGAGAHAIAFAGDGRTGYISNQTANSVSVIDVTTRTVQKTIAVGMKPNGMVWRAR